MTDLSNEDDLYASIARKVGRTGVFSERLRMLAAPSCTCTHTTLPPHQRPGKYIGSFLARHSRRESLVGANNNAHEIKHNKNKIESCILSNSKYIDINYHYQQLGNVKSSLSKHNVIITLHSRRGRTQTKKVRLAREVRRRKLFPHTPHILHPYHRLVIQCEPDSRPPESTSWA